MTISRSRNPCGACSFAAPKSIIMSRLYTFFSFLFVSLSLQAQSFVELSCSAGYATQAYYRFVDDQTTQINNDSWDIAFTASGFQDAGIFVNESSASSFTDPQPEVELYLAPTNDFNDIILPGAFIDRRYNDEKTWFYGGFNADRDTLNPFDFGWGQYQPASNKVIGQRVFVLKLRNGNYRKLIIDSLVVSTYYFRWANLDGTDEQSFSINKTEHTQAGFAYFSLAQGKLMENPPIGWDLFWGRHTTPLDDGQDGIIEYNVTGVLSGPGIAVAEADSVDPLTVDFYADGYAQQLSTDPTVIGSDWKYFDFATGWQIDLDRVFFVKTRDNHIWRMTIVDFEGISTGTMVFEKFDLGLLSALESNPFTENAPLMGPNPARPGQEIFMDWTESTGTTQIMMTDLNGKMVWNKSLMVQKGFQVAGYLPASLPSGTYILTIQRDGYRWSRPWIIIQ